MRKNRLLNLVTGLTILAVAAIAIGSVTAQAPADKVARGEYLVTGGGCSDCHTTKTMGPSGPALDMTHLLAGHPAALVMPPTRLPEGPWMGVFSGTLTAWAGPWGVSFAANLTPDKETGLGAWTETTFVETIRAGRVMGKGRMILPPMPVDALRNLTDQDLQAMFAYLQTIPVVVNRVPEPVAPPAPPAPATK